MDKMNKFANKLNLNGAVMRVVSEVKEDCLLRTAKKAQAFVGEEMSANNNRVMLKPLSSTFKLLRSTNKSLFRNHYVNSYEPTYITTIIPPHLSQAASAHMPNVVAQ